jgi:hypothetical protein
MTAYTCPYCGRPATLTTNSSDSGRHKISLAANNLEYDSRIELRYTAVVCPSETCRKLNLIISLCETENYSPYASTNEIIEVWHVLPESIAKPLPPYIPKALIEDYTEACRIQKLSPKAAATLARRCMQGMIRDFFSISKDTLYQEIDALKGSIPTAQWDALDALRKIGNIGAHMEKDVNLVVEIEPDEVKRLIGFIEYLFEQWYIKRHDDEESLAEIVKLAGIKTVQRRQPKKENP